MAGPRLHRRLRLPLGVALPAVLGALLAATCLALPRPAGRADDAQQAAQAGQAPVYIVLWFDTEDYILPESDDAAKRVAEMLTSLGVRATFKVVGEKGRTLERRGRTDVIAALSRHEIGYHANTHSQHPTVAEYESSLDWEEGAAEFTRRERPGFDDLRRIFGRAPSCYGQPGSSWAPQVFPALKSWGVKVYLDDARQVGLNGRPFWFGGLLNIFNLKAGSDLRPNDDWSNLAEAKTNFEATYRELSQSGGGVVSLYFHPCEFIHREFWDAVNFAHGANPPRDQWKLPPMKSPAEIERDFNYLQGLVTYMKSFPEVRFVTASEALAALPDTAQGREFSGPELGQIAAQVTPAVTFQVRGGYALAASEVFALLNGFVSSAVSSPADAKTLAARPVTLRGTPYGPGEPAVDAGLGSPDSFEVPWSQFSRTVLDVNSLLEAGGQIPDAVWFGSERATPESYLVALAGVATNLLSAGAPPSQVAIRPATLDAARFVADDSPKLWDWIIFPSGFDAPHLMRLAKPQAWTLKPALLRR